MTDERLAEIKARCDAATPGPWQPWCRDFHFVRPANPEMAGPILLLTGTNKADSQFAAHARADIPALLAENAALRARVAALEAECDRLVGENVRLVAALEKARVLELLLGK